MTTVIKVEDLSKTYKVFDSRVKKIKNLINPFSNSTYREFYALKDVSFKINKGEIVGIIGNNGAGKSTLLKILTGVAYPSSGEVEVNGRISSLLELGTGFNPELTGIENIYFNGSLMGLTTEEIDNVVDDIIKFADIGEFINQPVKHYSSGMYARLAFAVSINVNPDILIVDEILSVGDVGFQQKCMKKFEEFKRLGKTILYVSHGLETVQQYCEKAIWLENGRVVEIGPAFDVVENYFRKLSAGVNNSNELNKKEFVKLNCIKTKNDKTDFKYGEKIEFELEYEVFKENLTNPSVTIELRKSYRKPGEFRNADQFICSINSNVDNFVIPWKKGVNKISFCFDNIMVKQGNYYLDVIFSESQNLVSFETVQAAINFNINNSNVSKGFAFLENEWKF